MRSCCRDGCDAPSLFRAARGSDGPDCRRGRRPLPDYQLAMGSPHRPNERMTMRMLLGWLAMAVRDPDVCDLLCLDLPRAERVRRELPAAQALEAHASGAKALGDPTRLTIALALYASDSACVCDLAWIVARDDRLVSHHVRQLKAAGLATSRRDGKMVMYELTERRRALVVAVAPEHAQV